MASVYNPIDNIVYKRSNNWTPEKKPQEQEWMTFRNPLEHPDIKALPPLKLRKSGKRLDLIQMRRERRNRLLNIKASQIERELKDGVEKNEAELLYEKQMAELEKLKAQMGKGILAFFVDYTANKAQEQFRDRFLMTDPDIALFDKQSADYIKSVQDLYKLREENEAMAQEIQRDLQDEQRQLIDDISVASSEEELEELAQRRGQLASFDPLFGEPEETIYTMDTDDEGPIDEGITIDEEMEAEAGQKRQLEEAKEQVQDVKQVAEMKRTAKRIYTIKPKTIEEARQLGNELKDLVKQVRVYEARSGEKLSQEQNATLKKFEKINVEDLRKPAFVREKVKEAKDIMRELQIRTPSIKAPARKLLKEARMGEMSEIMRASGSITPPPMREAGAGNF